MNTTSINGKIASAALALALTAVFNGAQAQTVAEQFNQLPTGTAVVDFVNTSFYADYQVDLISNNFGIGTNAQGNTRFVGYGWSQYAYAKLTRPADQDFSKNYSGTIEITRHDGGQFAFESTSFYGTIGDLPYMFTGWQGSTQVFSSSGWVPDPFDKFVSTENPDASQLIDRLEITLTSLGTPGCMNEFCVAPYVAVKDIILLKASAVPEPASWALMLAGAALMLTAAKRRHAV